MDTYLGEFEHLVLLAVLRVGDDAYAVPVRAEIESRAGRAVSRGALYATLDRLEQKGLLAAPGDPLPERGGRARRYYAVARRLAGLRAARKSNDGLSAGSRSKPSRRRASRLAARVSAGVAGAPGARPTASRRCCASSRTSRRRLRP